MIYQIAKYCQFYNCKNISLKGAGVPEWLIHEDWALLQVFAATSLKYLFIHY